MNTLRKPTTIDVLRLLAVSAIWGSAFMCITIALRDFSPIAIAGWRVAIAAVVVVLICRWQGLAIPRDKKSLVLLAIVGLFNSAIPFSLVGWGQSQGVNSASTALLISASPFATLLFSHFMTQDDRFTWFKMIGMVIGSSGVVVLLSGELAGGGSAIGMLAILSASFCYAFSTLMIRKLGSIPGLVIVAGALTVSTIVLMPLVLIYYPPTSQATSFESVAALIYLAMLPTALAYFLRTHITQINGATFMSNAGYLIPFFAVIWGWLFLAESPQLNMLLALVLICGGIALGQKR
ncbi:MAG: DMT family transporter [Granulosicoccaceae bacterium]